MTCETYKGFEIEENERYDDDSYRELLDEVCKPFRIGSLEYSASQVLEAVDPIAFRCGIDDVQEYYYTVDGIDEEFDSIEGAREAIDEAQEA